MTVPPPPPPEGDGGEPTADPPPTDEIGPMTSPPPTAPGDGDEPTASGPSPGDGDDLTTFPPPPATPGESGEARDLTTFPPPSPSPGGPVASIPPPPPAPLAAPPHSPSATRPPRPQVRGAAMLVIAGALLAGIAVYLPWMTGGGETFNGTDTFVTGRSFADLEIIEAPGDAMLFLGAVLVGLGIALYFAGRILAVAILAIVGAAVAILLGIGMIAIVDDSRDFIGQDRVSFAFGVMLQPIGPALSLAGSIWATATRRR